MLIRFSKIFIPSHLFYPTHLLDILEYLFEKPITKIHRKRATQLYSLVVDVRDTESVALYMYGAALE